MHIQSVQSNSYNMNSPNFKHWNRTVYKLGTSTGLENVIRRNNTEFFRDPAFWLELVDFLEKKWKDIPKFNIYSYGCSDGSDALSLVMSLLARGQKNILEKFSPIIAKDIDPVAIERAKSGIYEIIPSEKSDIELCTGGKFKEFFQEFNENSTLVPDANMSVNPEVTKHVYYGIANVLEDLRTISSNNSIVLLRNILPYINQKNNDAYYKGGDWRVQKAFLEKLYKHLGENSYIAIGEYDRYEMRGCLIKMLEEAGFEQTSIYNLYRRVPEKEKAEGITLKKRFLKFIQKVMY